MLKKIKKLKKHGTFKNLIMFLAGLFILFFGIVIVWLSSIKIPDFHSFDNRKVVNSTKIYDRTGQVLLYDIHQDIKRTNISSIEMGANIKNATVAVEDSGFYSHKGVKLTSTVRAVFSNIFHIGIGGGGSTITQQLVKNTLLTSKKTIARKIKEWILAVKIDNSMTKDKILELYLNEAPYGGTVYGIEEAAKTYFGKHASELTIAEAAYLAAIPQSPTTLSPYGKNKQKLEDRKNFVLSRMLETKFIDQEQFNNAKKETVVFLPQQTTGIKAPHFVFFIKEYLENKYGSDVVENGGLKVTSTIDWDLQQKGEQIVKEGALENEKSWNGSNAGLVAVDPKTGQILTMIGSRDYFDKKIDGNFNITTANRQPGSSFKPFIYATAFNKGFTPDTVLFDLPTEFQTTCNAYGKALPGHNQSDCYKPDNYDNKFRGPISLRNALAQSINIPAVKLLYLVGIKDAINTAENMGISSLSDPSRYGLTLVIGGGEVSLLEITSAYGVLANNGIKNNTTGILKIEDSSGKVYEEYSPRQREVLPKNTALIVSDILSDNNARIPTFGARSVLEIPGKKIAVKTGTTNNNKDAWTIGYTPAIAVGVWVGNNDNKPMKKGGAALAGPIWNKYITEAINKIADEKFEKPNLDTDPEVVKPILRGFWQGNEHFFIDKISGKLATEFTPKETKQEKIITNVHSILYWVNKKDITGEAPSNPDNDSQFNHWEIPVQNWWAQNSYKYGFTSWASKPNSYDDIHTGSSKPNISIIEPSPNNIYQLDQKIQLKVNSNGKFQLQKIDIFINNIFVESSKYPFNYSFIPSDLENIQNENQIKIIAYDTAYNHSEITSIFKVQK